MTPAELRALAEAAPGRGRWRAYAGSDEDGNWGACAPTHEPFEDDEYDAEDRAEKDAAFISAASPSEVLGLLDRLEAAEREVERLRGAVHADLIADTHYCERHEMMYQTGHGAPPSCPHCEVERLRRIEEAAESAITECQSAMLRLSSSQYEHDIVAERAHDDIDGAVAALRSALTRGTP